MQAYLETHDVELIDFAYTLQVGRDEMPERLALVVSSTEELKQKFGEILSAGEPQGSYRNHVVNKEARTGETFVQALIERKELSRLAELWVSGAKIDWRLLHKPGAARRISVPTYPFARERYWIPGANGKIDRAATRAIPQEGVDQRRGATGQEEVKARLETFVPVWNPVRLEESKRIVLPESTRIVLLGSDRGQLDWVRKSYPRAELLEIVSPSSVGCSFDQLLWVAPDVNTGAGR